MSKRRGLKRSRPPLLVAFWVAGGLSLAIVAVLVGLIAFGGSSTSVGFTAVPADYPYPVQAIERLLDRTHFAPGTVFDGYNSNPPTSGRHTSTLTQWGISDAPVQKEMPVHNMEHGGAVVWYNCDAQPVLSGEACTELRNQLGQVVQSEIGAGKQVLMTPYADMEHRIALTAWGFLDAFDEFDAERVRKFIETFECNFDPEGFC